MKRLRKLIRNPFKTISFTTGKERASDFHMQAQVFTEKVSCQGLFWKEKWVECCILSLSWKDCLHEASCALIICFACYSLPTQSDNLRGPRVAGKTDDRSTCRGRNTTCERRKILLLVPFLILVWHSEPINKFKLQAIICTPLQVNINRISEEILVKCSVFLTLHFISVLSSPDHLIRQTWRSSLRMAGKV